MSNIVKNFQNIRSSINNSNVNIIAVSKTFKFDKIKPLIDFGHNHFGENKVQEAKDKWLNNRQNYPKLQLHMIGKLQTNKVKDAVQLFDYIHSVDNEKLANTIVKYENLLGKKNKYFIQVNIGNETQKSGININKLSDFYLFCKKISLNVIGLMCIPPANNDPESYFQEMKELNKSLGFSDLSMGMSSDFLLATKYSSTYIRVGSKIFGQRN